MPKLRAAQEQPVKTEMIAVVSASLARRRFWIAQLARVPSLAVAGAWPALEHARAAGVRLDAVLLDLGRGAPLPSTLGEAALSPREEQVFALLAGGCRDKDLAPRLGVSAHTARTFLRRGMAKLGATSRAEAVARWLKRNLAGAADQSGTSTSRNPTEAACSVVGRPPKRQETKN